MFSKIFVLVILTFLNAFFAAAEMAFVSLNDAKVDKQAKEGNKKAISIQKMLKDPSKFLATIQIGITLAGFLASAFAADYFADYFLQVITVSFLSTSVLRTILVVLITIVLSYFTLVLGELVPKRIAMKYYEKIAFGTVRVIRTIAAVASPFVKFLTFSTNMVSKLFGVSEIEEETVTEEEIRMMVDVGEEKGAIDKEEKEMINNVFEFNDKVVSEIMVPRTEIYAVDMNLSISKVLEEITDDDDFRFSRIPVYEETIDDIKGVVYIKDILLSTKNKNVKIKNLVKEAYYVPETKPLNELFNELRKNRKQIAIVVDEYGGTAGVVTMEDILEEIVGEIYDEYDEVEKIYEELDELNFRLTGGMSIYEVEKVLDVKIPEGDYDTLSGYLVELLGRIPTEKDKAVIETPGVIYKLEKVEDMRIASVRATKVVVEEPEDEEDEDSEDEE